MSESFCIVVYAGVAGLFIKSENDSYIVFEFNAFLAKSFESIHAGNNRALVIRCSPSVQESVLFDHFKRICLPSGSRRNYIQMPYDPEGLRVCSLVICDFVINISCVIVNIVRLESHCSAYSQHVHERVMDSSSVWKEISLCCLYRVRLDTRHRYRLLKCPQHVIPVGIQSFKITHFIFPPLPDWLPHLQVP